MVEYEESFIKCYARKSPEGEIQGYQRRILLSSTGKLGGCPEDPHPLPVVVLNKNDYLEVKRTVDTYQTREKEEEKRIDTYKQEIEELKRELREKDQDIKAAIGFIGVAWAGIQDLKGRSWWDRLRGNIPESLIQLHKPPHDLLPLPHEEAINLEDDKNQKKGKK